MQEAIKRAINGYYAGGGQVKGMTLDDHKRNFGNDILNIPSLQPTNNTLVDIELTENKQNNIKKYENNKI